MFSLGYRATMSKGKKRGFTGIILLPGSFSGRMSSPRPHLGPLHKQKCKNLHNINGQMEKKEKASPSN